MSEFIYEIFRQSSTKKERQKGRERGIIKGEEAIDDEPDQRRVGAGSTVFDGESKVKDVFSDVIIQKLLRDREKKTSSQT